MDTQGFDPSGTIERNVALELVRVTEAAALNAAPFMGQGRKEDSDKAAVDAMRSALSGVDIRGVVVIGEGDKDHAPKLFYGEQVGRGFDAENSHLHEYPMLDIAVDPIDGTTLLSKGMPGSIAVIAAAERGKMFAPPEKVYYMEKIAVGASARDVIDIEAPTYVNLERVAAVNHCPVSDIVVTILDRPRHAQLIKDVREAGARIRLISDGDVIGAIQAVMEEYNVDVYMGIGGAPEAVLAAAAIKCLGGDIQTRIVAKDEENLQILKDLNIDMQKVYHVQDLVAGNDVSFAATGITTGDMLRGVEPFGNGKVRTNSIMMRARSGTIRNITAIHRYARKHVAKPEA